MSEELRVGIVGCGGIARAHANAYRDSGRAKIISVFDIAENSAAKLAAEYGSKTADNIEQMASGHNLDAVSICTPPGAHYENGIPFLKKGIAVLCEKPLAINMKEAQQIAKDAEQSESVFMTAFCHRFHPAVIKLKELVESGTLGRPLHMRNIFGGYMQLAGNHRANKRISGGGTMIDTCPHSIDLFRFLCGEPQQVQAVTSNIMQNDIEVEDFATIHLTSDRNVHGEITASHSFNDCGNWLELYCEKGMAVVSYWNEGHPDLSYKTANDGWTEVDCRALPDRFCGQISHFLDCAANNRQPSVTIADGLAASRILDAAYESAASGRRVTI